MGISGYQEMLITAGFGFGYTPVFLQYFGMYFLLIGTLFHALLSATIRNTKESIGFCGRWLLCSCWTSEFGQNRYVALEANKFYLNTRNIIEAAMDNHLFDEIPTHGVLLRTEANPFDCVWNYATHLERILDIQDPAVFIKSVLSKKYPQPFSASFIQDISGPITSM